MRAVLSALLRRKATTAHMRDKPNGWRYASTIQAPLSPCPMSNTPSSRVKLEVEAIAALHVLGNEI